jgi:hypothetical protein
VGFQLGKLEIWWEYQWNAWKFVKEDESAPFIWTIWVGPFELTWFKYYEDEKKDGKN